MNPNPILRTVKALKITLVAKRKKKKKKTKNKKNKTVLGLAQTKTYK